MTGVFLTLNIPGKGLASGKPVVATYSPEALQAFKQLVLADWKRRIDDAPDDLTEHLDKLEYKKIKDTLDLLVPEEVPSV